MQTQDSAEEATLPEDAACTTARRVLPGDHLTDRELTVAELVASGTTNNIIARKLSISPHTVGQHIRSVLRKTGARTRAELIARLYVSGLLDSTTWPPGRRAQIPRTRHSEDGETSRR